MNGNFRFPCESGADVDSRGSIRACLPAGKDPEKKFVFSVSPCLSGELFFLAFQLRAASLWQKDLNDGKSNADSLYSFLSFPCLSSSGHIQAGQEPP